MRKNRMPRLTWRLKIRLYIDLRNWWSDPIKIDFNSEEKARSEKERYEMILKSALSDSNHGVTTIGNVSFKNDSFVGYKIKLLPPDKVETVPDGTIVDDDE